MGGVCGRPTMKINSRKISIWDNIGEGGFSTVYLVRDVESRKNYALKKIICHSIADQHLALKEIEYHSLVKHPNIIEQVDYSVSGRPDPVMNSTSEVYLLLPYYQRGSLAHELEMRSCSNSFMKPDEVLTIFLELCDGLKAFHEAKPVPLAHRDLKTANILMTDQNSPIIMDLGSVAEARVKVCGLAEAQTLQDIASERCSMPYRAPELFSVDSYCMIDERSDIWSLGCVLYAMCYFKSPFDAAYERGDSVALAVMSRNVDFPPNSIYSQDMHDLILYMMKVNPMERPYIYSVIEKAQDVLSKLEATA